MRLELNNIDAEDVPLLFGVIVRAASSRGYAAAARGVVAMAEEQFIVASNRERAAAYQLLSAICLGAEAWGLADGDPSGDVAGDEAEAVAACWRIALGCMGNAELLLVGSPSEPDDRDDLEAERARLRGEHGA